MKNLLPLLFAVVLGVACFIPTAASAYYYGGRYYPYSTEAITTDIATKDTTTDIIIGGTTIGSGRGLAPSMSAQGIIAIGKRIIARTALTLLSQLPIFFWSSAISFQYRMLCPMDSGPKLIQ